MAERLKRHVEGNTQPIIPVALGSWGGRRHNYWILLIFRAFPFKSKLLRGDFPPGQLTVAVDVGHKQNAFGMNRLNPRCVLSDHMPQGKHRALMPALEECGFGGSTHWILAIRGVVGDVAGVWLDEAVSAFRRFYTYILWYGDRTVLGESIPNENSHHFGRKPGATGYVSRLADLGQQKHL